MIIRGLEKYKLWLSLTMFLMTLSCNRHKAEDTAQTDAASQSLANMSNEQQVQKLLNNMQTQHLDFDTEFTKAAAALKTYQASNIYKNPQNDGQKLLAMLADMMEAMNKDTIKRQILGHNFAAINTAFLNMGTYQNYLQNMLDATQSLVVDNSNTSEPPTINLATANQVIKSISTQTKTSTSTSLKLTDSIPANGATVPDSISTESATTNTSNSVLSTLDNLSSNKIFLLTTGGFVLVFAAFGVFESLSQLNNFRKIGLTKYKESFVRNFFVDSTIYGKTLFLLFTSGMIIYGLTKDGNIDPEQMRDPMVVAGILAGMTAVYWAFEAAMNIKGGLGNVTDKNGFYMDKNQNLVNKGGFIVKDRAANYYLDDEGKFKVDKEGKLYSNGVELTTLPTADQIPKTKAGEPVFTVTKDKITLKSGLVFSLSAEKKWVATSGIPQPPQYDPKKYYKIAISESIFGGRDNVWVEQGGKANFIKSIGGAVVLTVFASGTLFAYVELHLTDEHPDETFIASMLRFYATCQLLSEKGVLVLN